jgi:plastocyanin
MTRRPMQALGLFAMLALAGCGGAAATGGPSVVASAAPAASSAAGAACAASTDTGTVAVSIVDFSFAPAAISAKVGDIITFTNDGTKSHSATLDQGDCGTGILAGGASGGLTFSKAGTYAFHCAVHSSMTGTIAITE